MIPRLSDISGAQTHYLHFMNMLARAGFEGEIAPDYANRTALATDNSIYQLFPQGVVYPRHTQDLLTLTHLASLPQNQVIVLTARGGGTGTNGQSLTDGIVVDTSRHMNQILEINAEEAWVRVQCGVVKDQLNAALAAHGLFFAPDTSTSNRATIGGMINTDASGQGSCRYGKTRDHVIELKTVLINGEVLCSHAIDDEALEAAQDQQTASGTIHRVVDNIEKEHRDAIKEKFPPLNRCLTGYDLAHIRDEDKRFNLNNIICGSEGTLGFVTEATLKVIPKPKHAALVIVYYDCFDASLRDAPRLMKADPTAIETIDSTILNLAIKDPNIWQEVQSLFAEVDTHRIQGMNLIEFSASSKEDLSDALTLMAKTITENEAPGYLGKILAWGEDSIKRVWTMRKKAVGLLGNFKGEARPVAFVEDTAVPPEKLADFIAEFRSILDAHALKYGMFGHVDAGVLHVRPALDMKELEDEKLVRIISDKVAELTLKYQGLFWGEHGKGVRSEYAPHYFGNLYPQLQRIKGVFDPHNQLNPGKIATPEKGLELLKIDGVPTRGQRDRKIPVSVWQDYQSAVYCNGNGACFNWDYNDAMCPSWKVTRDRTQSPKGRASLIKEWLRQLQAHGFEHEQTIEKPKGLVEQWKLHRHKQKNTLALEKGEYDFSHEVLQSMEGCLACKSCSGQCPVKVDVPNFRSKFLALYYSRYTRPLNHWLLGQLENLLPIASRFAPVANLITSLPLTSKLLSNKFGFVDNPKLSTIRFNRQLRQLGIEYASDATLSALSAQEKQHTVIIVQDAFTRYFEAELVLDCLKALKLLGFTPLLCPYKANGKPLHVHGFLNEFTKVATDNAAFLNTLAVYGIPLVGIDPAVTLTYRDEYAELLGSHQAPKVLLMQEWLNNHLEFIQHRAGKFAPIKVRLLAHCTEKTNAPNAVKDWQAVFDTLGLTLKAEATGCCGMSGTYGHEAKNLKHSKQLFQLSWSSVVQNTDRSQVIAATGYSCRSQVKRETHTRAFHPLQALLSAHKNS